MKGLIPERLERLQQISFATLNFHEEEERKADLKRWGQEPEKPWKQPAPVEEKISEPLGQAIWKLISVCTP